MLSEKNRKYHDDLRSYIAIIRDYSLYSNLSAAARIAFVALNLLRFRINYGMNDADMYGGAYLDWDTEPGHPVTFKWGDDKQIDTHPGRSKLWDDSPPGLECGGFVEAVVYAAGIGNRRIISYYNRRHVPEHTRLFQESKGNQNWLPSKEETTATQDAGLTGAWAQTPHLVYFDPLFVPRPEGVLPHIGDLVFFQSKDSRGYHVHVGIWANQDGEDGLVHSSPSWIYDRKSGPKFTPADSDYYRWLDPQRHQWAEWFGASAVRLKEAS